MKNADRRIGGGVAAQVYRHDLIEAINQFIGPALAGYRESARRWTALALAACAILMSWDPAGTAGQRFAASRERTDAGRGRRRRSGRTYQGFVKALLVGMTLWAERVTTHLYVEHRRIGSPRLKRFGFEALAADGTHVDCPRTRANEKGCGVWGREGSRPQLCMTVLWHMGTGLPAAWRIGRAETSERELLLSMLDVLEPGQLLVADAGFVGYDLLSRLTGEGIQVLIRVGSNVRLLTGLGWSVQEHNGRVYLWPQERRDRPPLTLRLVRVKRPGKADVCLLTSVLEPTRLSDEHAAALYRMRWGIEMFFRHAKQTLARRKMCSAAPAQAKVELHWTMVGLLVLGLLGVRRLIAAGRDPLGLSMAAVLKAVRAAAGGTLDRRGLDRALGHALKEDRQRASEKTSRNWPHKRSQRPPGEPKLRPATPQEIEAAKQLALKTAA